MPLNLGAFGLYTLNVAVVAGVVVVRSSVTSKKSPNVYKCCPKIISLEKLKKLTCFTKVA